MGIPAHEKKKKKHVHTKTISLQLVKTFGEKQAPKPKVGALTDLFVILARPVSS